MFDESAVKAIGSYAETASGIVDKISEVRGIPVSSIPVHDARIPETAPKTVIVHTLDSLIAYIKADRDRLELDRVSVHVASPTQVDVVSPLRGDFNQRFVYLSAVAETPLTAGNLGFKFSSFIDKESMNIALQSLFVDSGARAEVLELIGTVTADAAVTTKDDGVTQKVDVKAGVSLVSARAVPNPVTLAPFRTFLEVEQPASPFVLRLKNTDHGVQAALFEADGGLWKLEAVTRVGSYLRAQLPDSILVMS